MKIRKRITIPARQEDVVIEIQCDFCGRRAMSWNAGPRNTTKTNICFSSVDDYGIASVEKTFEAHTCSECFTEKVIPALHSLGCAAKMVEVDFH